jgi:hypothetical protein
MRNHPLHHHFVTSSPRDQSTIARENNFVLYFLHPKGIQLSRKSLRPLGYLSKPKASLTPPHTNLATGQTKKI